MDNSKTFKQYDRGKTLSHPSRKFGGATIEYSIPKCIIGNIGQKTQNLWKSYNCKVFKSMRKNKSHTDTNVGRSVNLTWTLIYFHTHLDNDSSLFALKEGEDVRERWEVRGAGGGEVGVENMEGDGREGEIGVYWTKYSIDRFELSYQYISNWKLFWWISYC